MKEGPDIAQVAALIGDPARANMLAALLDGRALSASELAEVAGVTPQTASTHLAKLEDGRLVATEKQGRHRYFRLGGPEVALVLENLTGLAARAGHLRTRPGPRDPAMRRARVCYDHLAGELGVALFEGLTARKLLRSDEASVAVTPRGTAALGEFGINFTALEGGRRPLCRPCLDWSERRHHLAGALGAALLTRFLELGWARREKQGRTLRFAPAGEQKFRAFVR